MDLEKIGKFIAECRKNKNMTQEVLASKMNITDRAVSKWERGLSLPDSSIMLDLCDTLEISVNELLIGERILKKDIENKSEQLLLEFAEEKEETSKKIMFVEQLIARILILFILALGFATKTFIENEFELTVIATIIIVFTLLICITMVKLEADVGYYECKKCNHKYKASYKAVVMAFHVGTNRYLKCPKCNKKSYSRKVFR